MTTTPPTATDVLRASGAVPTGRLAAAEQLLQELTDALPAPAGVAAARVVRSGGKRLRPLLTLLMAGDATLSLADERSLLVAAAATELVHAATLIHDDVLDAAPTRRGIPTIWATDGPAVAASAGDALLAAAFTAVAHEARPQVAQILARAAGSLAAGELMQRADAYRLDLSPERYEQRVIGKTGALFEAACELGALHTDLLVGEAGLLGRDLGIAFQLLDDLLDIEGDPAVTGKPRGTDLLDGTVTLPLAIAARRDPSLATIDLRALTEAQAAELCDALIASGACDEVRQMAFDRIASVQARIDALPGTPERRAALSLAAQALVQRTA